MSVSTYSPNTCQYRIDKLKDRLYLVSAEHLKDIHIDNGEAYITNLSETPVRIDGFNLSFTEEESLDERYKFSKTITISVHGYADVNSLNDKYYAIIETYDGTLYMVNVDFPSKVTHTFHLQEGVCQTDFTFRSQSNFPTLKVSTNIPSQELCIPYRHTGKIKLKLIGKNYVRLSERTNKITTYGDTFKDIIFNPRTFSFTEEYDGQKVLDTIQFDISLDNYKTSWHYNLLEFLENLYSAIIRVEGDDDAYYAGYNYGLIPSFSIKGSSSSDGSSTITVTLVESATRGAVVSDSIEGDTSDEKFWRYVTWVGNVKGYMCVGQGLAQYILQQEQDAAGNPTGRYKAYTGHINDFPTLNVIGEFSTRQTFATSECGGGLCKLSTNMPTAMFFNAVTCETYTLSSTCVWNITDLPSYITVSPSHGDANTNYSVRVCNTQAPTSEPVTGRFKINYGDNTRIIDVTVMDDSGFVRPSRQYITCLPQTVSFSYDPSCPITVESIDPALEYDIVGGSFTVTVPRNLMTSAQKVWNIIVKDCNNQQQTVYIIQDRTYEAWKDTAVYECYEGNSYVQQMRYTGTTADNINNPVFPVETRRGALIQEADPRCSQRITRWQFLGNYYCVVGNKIKALEQQVSTDGGINWTKTGKTKLGETVETQSSWCNDPAQYEWRITDEWQCGDGVIVTYTFTYADGSKFKFQDVPATGGTYDFAVTSLANSDPQPYTIVTACSWTHVTINSTGFTLTVDPNTDTDNDRECYIVLKQNESGNIISVNPVQQAGAMDCNTLLDSCCGRGSHPNYDIQLGSIIGASTTDGIQGGCTIRLSNTLPSWLSVTVDNTNHFVRYETLEYCYGDSRSFVCEFEKVTGGNDYCQDATVLVKQLGGQAPSTSILRWTDGTLHKEINPSSDAGSQTLSLISTIDDVPTSFTISESCDWITVTANGNTGITVSYTQNTSQTSRTCNITLTQNCSQYLSTCKSITLVVNQSAGSSQETYFRWGDNAHMYEYSATTTFDGYLTLVPFVSKVNGVDKNATLSANVSWIQTYSELYYNYNEVKPGRNETVYLDTNYTEEERTGILTLTQKETGDKIRVYITQPAYVADCSMTSFDVEEEVCIGQGLDFTFTVADTRCSRTIYFNLYQGSTMVRASATPSGGVGSGVFQTSTLTAGTATVTTVVAGQQVTRTVTVQNCGDDYWGTGLPVVMINTPNGQPITSKEVWTEGASIKIYENRETVVYDNSALSIRGRGNSSWNFPKKPYALKLEKKAEILGMPSSKRWALLANYDDRTLMRNQISNEIAHCTSLSTGLGWTPSGKYVELVFNGQHQGNYYLSEQVRVESNRLDIDEYSDCLYEIDRNDMSEDYTFRSAIKNFPYHIKSPDAPDVTYFKGKIDALETALNNGSGYASLLDYNSFADHWIIQELTQNFETRGSSPGSVYCYYVYDSNGGKVKMGPVWDFDYSTYNLYWLLKANREFCSGTTVPANGYMPNALVNSCSLYYDYLFNDSTFKATVKQRWNAMKSKLDAIASRFDFWYQKLYASEQLNWAMWKIPDDFEPGHHPDYNMTFLQAKNSAKDFYTARLTYLNGVINSF